MVYNHSDVLWVGVGSTTTVCGLCLLEIVVSNCILCVCSCLVLVLRECDPIQEFERIRSPFRFVE